MDGGGIANSRSATAAAVDAVVARARAMTDGDRQALARARAAVDETFHVAAWRAAIEIVAERPHEYFQAWVRIGAAHVPGRLEELVRSGADADPAEAARWQGVARLVRSGIDDALLARLGSDRLRPPDLRELYAPWQSMLAAAHAAG